MFRLVSLAILLLIASGTTPVGAEELNAGFVQGLWYAHDPVIAGEPTRIYVALRNNTDTDLTGTVRFTDNGSRIGVAYVSALPGRIVEAWVDWTPAYGEHTVAASLTNVQVHAIGESPETGEVANTLSETKIFVDYDTDKDGLLNEIDLDDDGDTVSDEAERERGTNPLKADPIPTEKKDEETEKKETPKVTTITQTQTSDTPRTGLEEYIPNGRMQTLVESVTETIAETKSSLDAYRSERKSELEEYFSTSSATTISSPDSTSGVATITRSRVDQDENFAEAVVRGGKALLSGLYSVVLTIISLLLAWPAILELALLLLIIYFIYRTARRFGRRRTNY
jgi:hypothetical protein